MHAFVHSFLRRFAALRFPRLAREESGIAAVEFALILPIMITLWIGGVEITGALSVDRRLNSFASSMGDLIARTKTITYTQINDVFDLSEAALFPYSDTGMSMRISAVDIDAAGSAKIAWSRARGSGLTAYVKNTTVNTSVPATLRGVANADTQIIMAEVEHTYRPAVGYVITGDLALDDRMFFVPRLVKQVKICPTADIASCVNTI